MKMPVNGELRRLKIISTVLGITLTAGGGLYGVYAWAGDYHEQFAKRVEVGEQIQGVNIYILNSSIKDYEDQLFVLEFKISNGEATPLDYAQKARIERQLADLQSQIRSIRRTGDTE